MSSAIPAIIMAGQDIKEKTTLEEQVKYYVKRDGERYLYDINKALVRIYGKPVIEHVLESAVSSPIDSIVIVGPAEVGEWLGNSEYAGRVLFREQGEERVENVLRGKEALGKTGPTLLLAGDLPLLSYRNKCIEEMLDEALVEEAVIAAPVISRTYARNQWGELFRPENSWASVGSMSWQDETHEADHAGNLLVKEGNYIIADFSDRRMNIEPLRGSLGLVKQRSLKNKLKGMYEIVRIVKENSRRAGYSPLNAVLYAVNKYIQIQAASKTRRIKSATEEDLRRIGACAIGVPPEEIAFPETRVFEQHPDLDSLEDAYRIAREIYRRSNGGKDISDYRELEDKITYPTESGEMPLIKAVGYDKLHAADFTRRKEDWALLADESFAEISPDILKINPFFNMEELFYAKMNHSLRKQKL